MEEQQGWQQIARKAQQYREASLAQIASGLPPIEASLPLNVTGLPDKLLSQSDIQITQQDPENLLSSLADQRITSVAVTEAFLRRATLAQKLVGGPSS